MVDYGVWRVAFLVLLVGRCRAIRWLFPGFSVPSVYHAVLAPCGTGARRPLSRIPHECTIDITNGDAFPSIP